MFFHFFLIHFLYVVSLLALFDKNEAQKLVLAHSMAYLMPAVCSLPKLYILFVMCGFVYEKPKFE